jgi:very-short-patch-repair endonuclease
VIRWTEAELAAHRARQRGEAEPAPPAPTAASAAARASAKRERSTEAPDIEGALVVELQRAGLGGYVRNHRFDPRRRLELDFAWLVPRVAIEVQGGIHSRGAHVRPKGYQRDAEKSRRAQLMGWLVLPCTAEDVRTGAIVEDVETALELRRPR